jgi:malonyl-CoA O-methyltransferase
MGLWNRWRRGKRQAASIAEVREYFERAAADQQHYPEEIDPRILHVRFVLEQLGPLGRGRAADIGSGKGRFARLVKQYNPEATIVAVDIAEAMLRRVPDGVDRVVASMTQLPFAPASLDGAWAVESLEHAVDIEAAIGELGRVVRPGGRVAIIDKNIEQWGRLETPAWEQWFGRRDLERQLRRHFREVASAPISYWEDVPADGLFLAWRAVK